MGYPKHEIIFYTVACNVITFMEIGTMRSDFFLLNLILEKARVHLIVRALIFFVALSGPCISSKEVLKVLMSFGRFYIMEAHG